MKKKNTKDITKYSQYNVIMTVINEFQQLNLFMFESHIYMIGDMSIKPILKFVIYLASLLKKKYQLFKKCYIYKKFWAFYGGRWDLFLVGNLFVYLFICGALGLGPWAGPAQVKLRV